MYREYRDVSLNGAVSQLCISLLLFTIIKTYFKYKIDMEMAGNHRADPNTIHIIRTCVV
jgi:hypothetical protein